MLITWLRNWRPPKHALIGLYLAILFWSSFLFKSVEPFVLPVVVDFEVEITERADDHIALAGHMNKVRNCTFIQLAAYSGDALVSIAFTETAAPVTRVEGKQAWGWWIVTPPVRNLALFSEHECWSGRVTTKLWEGVVK